MLFELKFVVSTWQRKLIESLGDKLNGIVTDLDHPSVRAVRTLQIIIIHDCFTIKIIHWMPLRVSGATHNFMFRDLSAVKDLTRQKNFHLTRKSKYYKQVITFADRQ
jgi:hypothetical protein